MRPLSQIDRAFHRRKPRHSLRTSGGLLHLGRAADKSMLWVAVATVMAATGGRFGRRAALRGLFAVGVASALANGPVKRVFGRRRPAPSRWVNRLPGSPTTTGSSFPSGHAASAFAFAAGAGQELPVLAGPLVALASAVSYSRVHAGVHHPSDVLGGALVGAGSGYVTRRLWPVAPHEPASAAVVLDRHPVEPSPGGAGLVIVVNPSAGSSGQVGDELQRALPEAEVVELTEGDDLLAALSDAADRGCAVGVAGGDGSINAAVSVAAEADLPLLVVPAGTLNHFALALGVTSVADAAEAVSHGQAVAVDRAVIDGHGFVNTASIGSYVELVDAREKLEDKIGKWPAVVVSLWTVMRRTQPVDVEIDGERRKVWMVFIGNCRYDPPGFAPSWREHLDDGQLDIRIVDGTHPWSRARLLLSVVTGRLAACGAYEQRYARSIHVKSLEGSLRLARDGETFGGSEEFTIAKADDPLLVYVPNR
ncbi:MAG: phosphatase PAP2 family protein [Actinomycetota bacterium]|nr:phosphatase PAP2 family protein [Actinomycetota bacterium]